MRISTMISAVLVLTTSATTALAQDSYDRFFGQYVASLRIAYACNGISVMRRNAAAHIAKSQDGLRKQKVIRVSYYGDGAVMRALGDAALTARGVDVNKKAALCRFGRGIAEQNDSIGRFLSRN